LYAQHIYLTAIRGFLPILRVGTVSANLGFFELTYRLYLKTKLHKNWLN